MRPVPESTGGEVERPTPQDILVVNTGGPLAKFVDITDEIPGSASMPLWMSRKVEAIRAKLGNATRRWVWWLHWIAAREPIANLAALQFASSRTALG